MCTRKYGDAPEVIMSGRLDLTFPYVPTHLHYIMLELLKNSMRATVEWHGTDADYPPIKVCIMFVLGKVFVKDKKRKKFMK